MIVQNGLRPADQNGDFIIKEKRDKATQPGQEKLTGLSVSLPERRAVGSPGSATYPCDTSRTTTDMISMAMEKMKLSSIKKFARPIPPQAVPRLPRRGIRAGHQHLLGRAHRAHIMRPHPRQADGVLLTASNKTKSEARNPKFETISNDQNLMYKTGSFRF